VQVLDSSHVTRSQQLIVGVNGPQGATSLHILDGSISSEILPDFDDREPGGRVDPEPPPMAFGLLLGPHLSRAQLVGVTGSVYCESLMLIPYFGSTGVYRWEIRTVDAVWWEERQQALLRFMIRVLVPSMNLDFGLRYHANLLTTLPA
jgi:hypothetical protein